MRTLSKGWEGRGTRRSKSFAWAKWKGGPPARVLARRCEYKYRVGIREREEKLKGSSVLRVPGTGLRIVRLIQASGGAMKHISYGTAIFLFAGCILARTPQGKLAKVTVAYVDSYGAAVPGCKVQGFMSFNEGDKTDYERNFEKLVGKNIPLGKTYRVILNCDDGSRPGPFWVSVSRADQFLLLSSWKHQEDYYTGTSPRLTVSISGNSFSAKANQTWVKVVGLYTKQLEVDAVDPALRSARFYNIQPGKFLVVVLTAGAVECVEPIKILGPNAKVKLLLSDQGCKAGNLSEAAVS